MDQEIWLPIPRYEELYLVSNQGRIRSLARVSRNGRGKTNLKGRIRKLNLTPYGYPYLWLSRNGVYERFMVHQLVALMFIGPRNGMDVCHNDGCPSNNYVSNLRYDTEKGNMADKLRHGTLMRGGSHVNALLTEHQVLLIRAMAPFKKKADLAKEFGVSPKAIYGIVEGSRWKHLPISPVMISKECVS